MHQSKRQHKRQWAIGLFIICVSILFVMVTLDTKNIKRPAFMNKIKPEELTPYEHLIEAKKALINEYKANENWLKFSQEKIYDARIHLEAIKRDSPEYIEAQRLMNEVKQKEAEMEKVSAILTQECMRKQREEVAGKLEKYFIGKNMYVNVQLDGEEKTILKLEYVSWSYPLIYRVINGTGFLPSLKKLGFKKVIFDATHNYSWTYDLEGNIQE